MSATIIVAPDVKLGATPLGELLAGLDADDLSSLALELAPYLTQPDPDEDRWLTTSEAARYLGISQRTLYRRMDAGVMAYEQECEGGRCYFTREALDAYRQRTS
jgi:excisionase family DNA binding protein